MVVPPREGQQPLFVFLLLAAQQCDSGSVGRVCVYFALLAAAARHQRVGSETIPLYRLSLCEGGRVLCLGLFLISRRRAAPLIWIL